MSVVVFRKLINEDEKEIFNWISNPDLRRMIGTRGVPTIESHKKWFANKITDSENLVRMILVDEYPIGIIGTNCIDHDNRRCEVFLYIGNEYYKGKGFGTIALNRFVNELIVNEGLHKVCARIFSFNIASVKLFEKCGFELEGVLKDHICIDKAKNSYCDLLWFGYIKRI